MKGHQPARPAKGSPRSKARSRPPLLPRDAKRQEQRLGAPLEGALRAARMRAGLTQADALGSTRYTMGCPVMLHVCRRNVRNGLEQDGTRRDAAGYRLLSIPSGYEVRARFC
jgi:hypothetical protein